MLKTILKSILWTIFIIIVMLAVLLLWIRLDVQKGREAAMKEAKNQPYSYPIRNSNFQLYNDWKQFYPQFSKDIENAKEYIYIHYFSIGSGEASKKFFDLLRKKAEEGVDVYYSVDRAGSLKGNNKWFKQLKKSGVHVIYSNDPHFPHIWYEIQHRNHRRIAVMDGKIGYTGGLNIAEKYTKKNWHDYQVRMTGEGVQDFENQFCKDWARNAKDVPPFHKKNEPKGDTRHYLKVYSGNGVVEDFVKTFDAAKTEIIIATPYFIPDDKKFMDALKRTSKRGVKITIMWPKKSDGLLLTQAAYPFVKDALQHNMRVYQYKKGIFHGKVVLIDRKYMIIGTVNIDSRSLRLNDEMSLFVDHSPFVEVVNRQVHKDLKDSREIKLDYFDQLSTKNKILTKIANVIHYFL